MLALASVFFFPNLRAVGLWMYTNIPDTESIYVESNNSSAHQVQIDISNRKDFLLFVDKSDRTLEVYDEGVVIKTYDANVRNELEKLFYEEDFQTPEGEFLIESMDVVTNPPWKRWMRLNTLDYARKVYIEAYIDGQERLDAYEVDFGEIVIDADIREFNSVNKNQILIRGIGIHGGGFSKWKDWTKGCVALANDDVIELFDLLKDRKGGGIGVPFIIQD